MKFFQSTAAILLAITLLFAAGCSSTRTQSSLGETIDDTVITTRVKAAIINDPDLKVSEINVETFKGVVQLSGFVATRAEIAKAGSLARNTTGVTSVLNDILIK
jgi:osmotically-inducible protein OsmY